MNLLVDTGEQIKLNAKTNVLNQSQLDLQEFNDRDNSVILDSPSPIKDVEKPKKYLD